MALIYMCLSISSEIDKFVEDICWNEPPDIKTICSKEVSSGILQIVKVRTVFYTTMAIELFKLGGQNLNKRKHISKMK